MVHVSLWAARKLELARAWVAFVKLFSFDNAGSSLELVPLSARRALDRSGVKLSLAGWSSLPLEARRALCELGEEALVAEERVLALLGAAEPAAQRIPAMPELPASEPPAPVVEAYRSIGRVSPAVWLQLSPLARYALAKLADGRAPERLAPAYAELVGHSQVSTHIGPRGGVHMVDVAAKPDTRRRALAESQVSMNVAAFELLSANAVPKGDVLATARLAGIMAAKKTSELIPLCHALALTHVAVELELDAERQAVRILARAETTGKTGVEMEALMAASVAALTIYDMLKAVDRAMEIGPTRLVSKSGGASGDYSHATLVRDP